MLLVECGEVFEAGLVGCSHGAKVPLTEPVVDRAGFEYLEWKASGGVVE